MNQRHSKVGGRRVGAGRKPKRPDEPNNIQLNVRVSEALIWALKQEADKVGASLPDFIRNTLEAELRRKSYLEKSED